MNEDNITQIITTGWEEIKNEVREESKITDVSYKTWIMPLKFIIYKDGTAIISVSQDNQFTVTYITEKFYNFFKVIISDLVEQEVDLKFILEKDCKEYINIEETPSKDTDYDEDESQVSSSDHSTSNLNPKYRFDTFVVGKTNQFAYNAALAVAENPGSSSGFNPLFLYGKPGLGKTHLMHSIGHFVMDHNKDAKVLYVTSEQFTNEVVDSLRRSKEEPDKITNLRNKYRTIDVLMVDDVQFILGKESTQEEFFHTFNELHQAGKQVILSSDRAPKEMENLDERFLSRFEMGLSAQISSPDYETKLAIILNKAESYGKLNIDKEIFEYIATNIKSNIRELEGAFNKIIAYSKLNNVDITLENAKEALKDLISPDQSRVITVPLIISTVSEHLGVKEEDIKSSKRIAEFVYARKMVMYLSRELTQNSLKDIGKMIGGKDHTTVISGIESMTKLLETDPNVQNDVNIIKKKLGINE